ncbi:Protein of unknown function DUF3328 [Neofusicoccum parvum]|nr:Protein of unknown function DUF3328 [Neofusicoccum parvum]
MNNSQLQYTSIPREEGEQVEDMASEEEKLELDRFEPLWKLKKANVSRGTVILLALNAILFLLSVAAIGVAARYSARSQCPRCYVDDEQCTQHLFADSPVIDASVVDYRWTTLDIGDTTDSVYRGPPTYEREKAWDALEKQRVMDMPVEELSRLNKTHDDSWIHTKKGGLAIQLEMHQQLHCLSTLRRWIYTHEFLESMGELPEAFHGTPDAVQKHVEDCVEILRVTLMCNSDVTPVLLTRDPENSKELVPDMSTKHKCRNFDSIVTWEDQHASEV